MKNFLIAISKFLQLSSEQSQGGHRSYDTYILNGWPQTNVVEHFLLIGSAK